MGQGDGQQGEQSGRTASQALNEAVLSLRETESSMCQKPGSQPGGQNHSERMGQIGQQQSQLNEESRSIAQRLTEQMRLSAGDRHEMQRMADEQRRIREQLEQMQRDETEKKELLGRLDAAHKDMQDVEQSLRDGATGDDLEQKQQRILSRLLDAQRSLNRQDFEPERESHTGVDVSRPSPADLPRDLLRENDRLRVDLLKAEADRYPSQYRAFIEAYLRSLNRARR
jgi:septal ring factor EnvC (AmiA/AmiB activator)